MQYVTDAELIEAEKICKEQMTVHNVLSISKSLPEKAKKEEEALSLKWEKRLERIQKAIDLEPDKKDPYGKMKVNEQRERALRSVNTMKNVLARIS